MAVQTTYPGVYIQERPSGVHTITGVSTSVTAFVGAAAKGPVDRPTPVANFAEYVRTFGPPLDEAHPMGHAVSHFFANGGSSAVIVRVIAADAKVATATLKDRRSTAKDALVLDAAGKGDWANRQAGIGIGVGVTDGAANPNDLFSVDLSYRTFDERSQSSVEEARETYPNLSMSPNHPRYALNLLGASQLVDARLASPAPSSNTPGASVGAGAVASPLTIDATNNTLRVAVDYGPPVDVVLFPDDTKTGSVSKAPADIVVELNLGFGRTKVAAVASETAGTLRVESKTKSESSAVVVSPAAQGDISQDLKLGLAWGGTEASGAAALRPAAATAGLDGGTEGATVTPGDIVPADGAGGIYSLESRRFPRFNLLCLPGVTADDTGEVQAALSFCAAQAGFLIVDPPADSWGGAGDTFPPSLGAFAAFGVHGAIYYPRVTQVETLTGGTRRVLNLPPSGSVAGVMARTDTTRGVWKAPAGLEAGVTGVSGLSRPTSDTVSGTLNPRGINVLRDLPAAGIVVWGARTLRGDDDLASEHKYIPVRRLTDYIASSLYIGTQFAVFEPNDPDLWAQLRLAVKTFMRGLFRQGAFQQSTARDEASSFFVTCDDTTNPQSEIDLGRVNVVVGFAPLKPAEFVVITITQISHLED